MSYRFMRIIVFFDLPVLTSEQRRDYMKFRKFLLKNGFVFLQESVYCKLALNTTAANAAIENVRKNKPQEGVVQLLSVTEKQYERMEYIIGTANTDVLNTDERMVVL